MTATPEQRAEALYRSLSIICEWGDNIAPQAAIILQGVISQALREAENAAYERAAEEADGCRVPRSAGPSEWAGGFIDGKNAAASSIRSLKTQEN